MKVIEFLRGVHSHPTAEMVYEAVKKDIQTITLATIYRNLNQLAQDGEIIKLEVNGEYRFDADISKHQHLVCKKCGKIKDLFQENISAYALKNINSPGFYTESVQVMFRGECKKC